MAEPSLLDEPVRAVGGAPLERAMTRWLLSAALLVPLVHFPLQFLFPFVVPRVLFFRALVLLAAAAGLPALLRTPGRGRTRPSPIAWALLAFLGSQALSTLSGVDVARSFWGNQERMMGLVAGVTFASYYGLLVLWVDAWEEWRRVLRVLLLAGAVSMAVAVVQSFDPWFWYNNGQSRAAGTLGAPIYVGGFGLFLAFTALLLVLRGESWRGRVLDGSLGVLALLGMVASGTRSSLLGLALGAGWVLVVYASRCLPGRRVRVLATFVAVGAVAMGTLYTYRTAPWVARIPAVGRAVNTSLEEVWRGQRGIAWRITRLAWNERPLLGWGPNNYFYAFNRHYDPASLDYGYEETWFDDAHSVPLNTLVSQGALGLAAYLGVFVAGLFTLRRGLARGTTNLPTAACASGVLVAHFVQSTLALEHPTSLLCMMVWLALADRSGRAGDGRATPTPLAPAPARAPARQGLALAGAGLGLALAFFLCVEPARANHLALRAVRDMPTNPRLALDEADAALAVFTPHADDLRRDFAQAILATLTKGRGRYGKDLTEAMLDFGLRELRAALRARPLDLRIYLGLAELLQLDAARTGNPLQAADAERRLEEALRLSPRRQQAMFLLATVKLRAGKAAEAIELLERAIGNNPRIGEGYLRLAQVHKSLGRDDRVKETLALARARGVVYPEWLRKAVDELDTAPSMSPGRER
ncbi:MAG: O-antigen ligase family protein [Planctomycetes bacterium]|nr:O-antigen ligase family protein [Planctomycetota bacterium]